MKTLITLTIGLFTLFSIYPFSTTSGETEIESFVEIKDTSSNYLDGIYQGQSRSKYTSEPYWGHIQISLENGSFSNIKFSIRDSSYHEYVDSMYGVKHYSNNPTYMQQCVNDGNGIKIYPQKLLKSQNLEKIDAISGATWSYNLFKASATEALKDAKIPTSIEVYPEINENDVHVFPNPFHSTVKLKYKLTKISKVNLNLYDNQGKLIKNLADQIQTTGKYCLDWDDCPAAGIYYYLLKIDKKEFSGKIIKLKK